MCYKTYNFFQIKNIIYFLLFLVLTSCNAYVSQIGVSPSMTGKNLKSVISINTGGSQTLTTVAPPGQPHHTIEISVGQNYQQTSTITSQGKSLQTDPGGVIE